MSSSTQGITVEQLVHGTASGTSHESGIQADISFDMATATVDSTQKLYDVLHRLVQTLSPALLLHDILHSLATLTKQAMETDLCVVMLMDRVNGQLTMQASFPDLKDHGVKVSPISIDPGLREKLCDLNASVQLPILDNYEQKQLNPLENVQYETLLVVPLLAGSDCIGLLNCYSSKNRDYSSQDQVLLRTIASQAALAIKHRQLADMPASGNSVTAFFDDLLSAKPGIQESLCRRATFLGLDLTKPHTMLMIEILPMDGHSGSEERMNEENRQAAYKSLIRLVQHHIQEMYPGSLLDERENILYCIVSLNKDISGGGLRTWLSDLVHMEREQHMRVFAGLSSLCHSTSDYQRGFAEAEEALQIGQCLNHEASCTHFNDLGAYRYIYAFARTNNLPDLYLEQVAAIDLYDQGHKRSELLHTLEMYLEHGGNIQKTCKLLDIHRNTLIQRLERIQSFCTINLDHYSNRLPLQVAIMIHKLRAPIA